MSLLRLTLAALLGIIICSTASAGNYTWTGTTSSDWATSTNWSPNGVPSTSDTAVIVSSSNDPVLDGARTVTQISINSGTLDLNGYTLTYTSKGLFYAGTITNGKIACSGGIMAHYAGATLDCKVSTIASGLGLNGSVFTDSVRIEYTGTSTIFTTGGNKFHGYTEIVSNGNNPIYMAGQSPYNPDSAFAKTRFVRNSTQGLFVSHNGTGHYFGDSLLLENNYSGAITLGYAGTVTYDNDIVVYNNVSSTVSFGTGSGAANHQLADGFDITSEGTSGGSINLDRFTYLGKAVIDIPDFSLFLNSNLVFEDTADIGAAAVVMNGAWFKDTASIRMLTGSAGTGAGGNMFDGPANISVYASELQSANSQPDTFNSTVYLNCLGGNIALAKNSTGTYFNGNIILKGKGGNLSLGNGANSGSTLARGYTVSTDTFNTGALAFRGFVQQGDTPQDLQLTGNAGTYFSHKTTFDGAFNIVTPSLYLNGGVFNGETTIEKTGAGISNTCSGGNVFNGKTTIIHDGATYMSYYQPDTFNYDVTFIHNNYQLYLSYGAGNYYRGKTYFRTTGNSTLYVSYQGASVFDGDIYIANSSPDASINFGAGNGSSVLANGYTIIEDTGGFNTGLLALNGFTKNGSVPVNLDFGTNGKLTFGENSTINGAINYRGGSFYLNGSTFNQDVELVKRGGAHDANSGGNIFNAELTVIDSSSGNILLCNSNPDDYNGNVNFITTSTGKIEANRLANATYAGNLVLQGTADIDFGFYNPDSRSIFDGAYDQVISGNANTEFKKIQINKSGGDLKLARDLVITDTLILADGILETDTHLIVFNDNSMVLGGTDTSFIEGKVKKIGDDAFTYPIGGNGLYRPLSISSPTNTNAAFIAEYFGENSDVTYEHDEKVPSINAINSNEYWSLDRDASMDTVNVTLSWNNITSCAFNSLDSLVVVAWADTIWRSLGNGITTGDTNSGTIKSDTASKWYSVFAIGTRDDFDCCRHVVANAGSDTAVALGLTVQIGTLGWADVNYLWQPDTGITDVTSPNPFVQPDTTQDYILTVSKSSCPNSMDTVRVVTNEDNGHTIVICNSGGVQTIGSNDYCELGIGNPSIPEVYTLIDVPGLSDVVAVTQGFSHNLALLNNGTVMAWGNNNSGQVGQPEITPQYCEPTLVPKVSCAKAIAAGEYFSMALLRDGTIMAWGKNNLGQLGNDDNNSTHEPVFVQGIANAIAISAGKDHALALLEDGTVMAWGGNVLGQLGNGDNAPSYTPVFVSNISDIIAIDAGSNHNIALKTDNTIYTWGTNYNGQLGTNNTQPSNIPVIPYGWSNPSVIDVAAGSSHTMILKSDGSTRVFGSNHDGRLGICGQSMYDQPTDGPSLIGAIDIVLPAVHGHGWAIFSDGKLKTWGANSAGQLGTGNTNSQCDPVLVNDLGVLPNYCPIVPNSEPENFFEVTVLAEDFICGSELGSLNVIATGGTGSYTYLWSPATGLSATDIANPTVDLSSIGESVTYTVTVIDDGGCSDVGEITVGYTPCCKGHSAITSSNAYTIVSGYLDHTNDWISQGYNIMGGMGWSPLNPSNPNLIRWAINGTFTVDAGTDFYIYNVQVLMGTGAKIIVEPGATLTIYNSWLHACNEMWDHIFVRPGGEVIVTAGTLIEDAFNALLIPNGAQYTVSESTFNKNWIHINAFKFFGSSPDPDGNVNQSSFLCHETTTLGNPSPTPTTLLPPLSGQRTFIGIASSNIDDMTVGGIGTGNYFDNANFGISVSRGSLESIHNTFANMVNDNNCPDGQGGIYNCGSGISSIGGDELIVDDNEFTDSRIGIFSWENGDLVTVENSQFTELFTGVAIHKAPSPNKVVTVQDNQMDDVVYGVYTRENPNADITIGSASHSNDITVSPQSSLGWGITSIEAHSLSSTTFGINHNTVDDGLMGIYSLNLFGGEAGNNDVVVNDYGPYGAGIVMNNSTFNSINNNHVESGNQNEYKSGIVTNNGPFNFVFCNTVETIGVGLHFSGSLAPCFVFKNEMDNYTKGLLLQNSTAFNDLGFTGQPWDNTWLENSSDLETYASNLGNHQYRIYHRASGGIYEPIHNDEFELGEKFFPTSTTGDASFFSCSSDNGVEMLGENDLKNMSVDALNRLDTSAVTSDSTKWAHHALLYMYLAENDTLQVADTAISNFYDSCYTANLGLLLRINNGFSNPDDYFSGSKGNIYLDSLDNLSTTLHPEDALRDVLKIALEKHLDTTQFVDSSFFFVNKYLEEYFPDSSFTSIKRKQYNYSSAQLSKLDSISKECPYETGPAVFMARAMLSQGDSIPFWYKNICEEYAASSSRIHKPEESAISNGQSTFNVYPNPNNGNMKVHYENLEEAAYFQLYDNIGKKVAEHILNAGSATEEISEENLCSGVYMFRIIDGNHKKLLNGKIIILH